MNKFELKAFKQAYPELNIINIISAIYKESNDVLTCHIAYKEKDKINIITKEIINRNRKPREITFEKKSEEIIGAIALVKEFEQAAIYKNQREEECTREVFEEELAQKCVNFYKQLNTIGYMDFDYVKEYKVDLYIEKKCRDRSLSAEEIYECFLKEFKINEKGLEDYLAMRAVPLKYDCIKSWS